MTEIERTVVGRSNEPVITITGRWDDGEQYGKARIVLEGAELTVSDHGRKFRIEARHENGTDFEHDAAKTALFEGVGLSISHSYASYIAFEGVLVKGWYYPEGVRFEPGERMPHSQDDEVIRICEDTEYYHPADQDEWPAGHLLMPYLPPQIEDFPVLECRIEMSYARFLKDGE